MKETRQLTQREMAQEVADHYDEMVTPGDFLDANLLAAAIEGCSMELRRYRRIEKDLPDISQYDSGIMIASPHPEMGGSSLPTYSKEPPA